MLIIESSTKDLPTLNPAAFRKVFAIPPPTIIWSATELICFNNLSFEETLAPPITAINGLSKLFKACVKYLFSFSNNRPAQAFEAFSIAA